MEKVVVNGKDITSLVFSFQTYEEMDKEHLIGNTVSTQIKLTLQNKDNQLKGLFDYPFIIGKKSYIVYEKPEKYTNMISVTLYDYMLLANVRYNSQLEYPTTISAQLDEMAAMCGIEMDKFTLSEDVLKKEVNWYDNTMTIRNYLSFIAQIDGKNAFVVDDLIVFRPLATNQHSTNYCSNYELNEQLQFTRVVYDDGIQLLSNGEKSGKTLYLSPNNSYVTQEDVDRVYGMYQGLTFYSFKKFKCYGIDDLMLTDLVSYHNFTILPLSIKRTVNGGIAKDSLELAGDIVIKNVESVIIKEDVSIKIKRIQTTINQNETYLDIVAQTVDEQSEQIGKLLISNEEIQIKVEEVEKKNSIAIITPQYAVTTTKETPTEDEWTESEPDLNVGEYLWMREKYTYQDGKVEYNLARIVSGQDGKDGETSTLLRIESSRGTVFKNDNVDTVLSVVIYHGSQRITDSVTMKQVFGNSAYLEWYWQRLDDDTYGVILSNDPRFGDNGFTFTLSPEDVNTKVTFMCELHT